MAPPRALLLTFRAYAMIKQVLWVGFFVAALAGASCSDGRNVAYNDYRLFDRTPLHDLARAVEQQDTAAIRALFPRQPHQADYAEPKFGNTLLMLTVANQQYDACRALLQLGADVHPHDTFSGSSALIQAAGTEGNARLIRLLLQHGANPNDLETGPRRGRNTQRFTPLIKAAAASLENVQVLVGAGAGVNYENEYQSTALSEALLTEHYEIALCLLQKGARDDKPLFDRDGKDIFAQDLLAEAEARFPANSTQGREIKAILDFISRPK